MSRSVEQAEQGGIFMTEAQGTMTAFLGIDVAKEKVDSVLLVEQRSGYQVFANTPTGFEHLSAWLRQEQVQRVHACLEATGSYSDGLALYLVEQGHLVSVLNPAILVNYRRSHNTRSKTDKLDAMLLAQYARERQPRAWSPLPSEVAALRSLLAYRTDVQAMLLQARNRQRSGRLESWVAGRLQTQIEQLVKELKLVEERTWKHLETSSKLSATWCHLQTICGIGQLAAAQLIAQIGEIERFGHPGALVSLAGLAVKHRESGSSVRGRAQMDRHGRSSLRQLLYMCALVAMRWDPQMRAWAQQLKARGKPTKVVLVAVMRKLLHIVYGVWKNASEYDAHLAFPATA
jgi:transposase